MSTICFYFQVHQPRRIKDYRVSDIGEDHGYFNEKKKNDRNNKFILERVSRKCYLPTNKLFLKLLKKHPEMKISFSLSGIFLEQIEDDFPEVVKSFQDLVKTGRVEILSETYYHSLAFLYDQKEFERQVEMHRKKVWDLFGVVPQVFRNTELIYSNDLGRKIDAMGFKGILAEGADHILRGQSPHQLYRPVDSKNVKLLLKSYKLSDDIAFRFSEQAWEEHPLSTEKFVSWTRDVPSDGIINLFMDYETFGEHQWEDSGIFEFLEDLPRAFLKDKKNTFMTPSEVVDSFEAKEQIDAPQFFSWADEDRDLSAWLSNDLQKEAAQKLYDLGKDVLKIGDPEIIEDWRRLQTSDHFYYMCTKWHADGDVHKYFSPYETPYDAFIVFINVLNDLKLRVEAHKNK